MPRAEASNSVTEGQRRRRAPLVLPSRPTLRIDPAPHFRGRFRLPGDKSISHRAALLGAMARGRTRIDNYSEAADCTSTLACLSRLGVSVERDGPRVRIDSQGIEAWQASAAVLDCENSGSTIRMLAGALAGRPFRSVLTGDESLRRRPLERVAAPLRQMGATITTTEGRPPISIDGGRLRGIDYALPVASAQVKTAVLLAGLQAEGTTLVSEPSPSRDHTERMLPVFGAPVERQGLRAAVRGGTRLRGADVRVPGDASSAAFLVVAALVLPDSEVVVEDVLLSPTRVAFVEVLRAMGGQVEVRLETSDPEPVGAIVARTSRLRGAAIDPAIVPALIDEVPALAAAAAFADGTLTVTGAAELRIKESDRIAALAGGLQALGVRLRELPDGLVIEGGAPLRGAAVRSFGDHRIAMALSIAALGASGSTEVEGAECVGVSFPSFYAVVRQATGRA